MKKITKILFVCKHNRFRSRVAEAYFNKIKPRKNIVTRGGGLIVGTYPLDKTELIATRKLGLDIDGKPQALTMEKIIWADLTIIVADDIPSFLFDHYRANYKKKIIIWKIKDIKPSQGVKDAEVIIKQIMSKVDRFVKSLV